MSLYALPRTIGNFRRATQSAMVLTRHGFGHLISRLGLSELVPGFARFRMRIRESAESASTPMPQRVARVLEELGPTFIKFGQILANRPDLIPQPYLEAFARLQDRVEPFPGDQAVAMIERSLGQRLDELFAAFDRTPVASGSIGQVHDATLRDGTPVVVKVKRPQTDERVREDLDILQWVSEQVARHIPELEPLRPRMLVDEFSRAIRREIDFVSEGSYTAKFVSIFEKHESIVVPGVHWDLTSRDVLVLDRIAGQRLTDPDRIRLDDEARHRIAQDLGRAFMHQFFITGMFHADPHPGNMFLMRDGRLGLVDFGQVGRLSTEMRQQLALALVALVQGDFDAVADVVADLGGLTDVPNVAEFRAHIMTLIDRYYGIPIEKVDFGHAFEEVVTITREHGVVLPRDLVLFGKSLVTVVGVAQMLDPGFRIDQAAQPFSKRVVYGQFSPWNLGRTTLFSTYRLLALLRRFPRDLRDIIQKMRSGELRVIFHHEGLDDLTHRLDRGFSRMSLSLVLAAIIIGSAQILTSPGLGKLPLPLIGETPIAYLFSGLGFAAAVIIGFALIWSIFRSNRM